MPDLQITHFSITIFSILRIKARKIWLIRFVSRSICADIRKIVSEKKFLGWQGEYGKIINIARRK
jgi:hypothetical protein